VPETVAEKIVIGLIGGMLLALAAFLMWPALEHFKGEATVYRMFCTSSRNDDSPCVPRDELTSVTETYKAFPDQQSVIVWIGDGAPAKLSNCAVRDALNWRCTRNDKKVGTVDLSMASGQLSETIDALALVAGEVARDIGLEKRSGVSKNPSKIGPSRQATCW
jgi:hypothetical protein